MFQLRRTPPNFAAQAATDFAGEASEMGCSETKMLGEVTAKLRRRKKDLSCSVKNI
jgi:hypothetical protein